MTEIDSTSGFHPSPNKTYTQAYINNIEYRLLCASQGRCAWRLIAALSWAAFLTYLLLQTFK